MEKSPLVFKNACAENISDIININDSYLNYNSKKGFLITKYERQYLYKQIEDKPDCIYVAINDGKLIGFIEINFVLDTNVFEKLNWFNKNAKNIFEHSSPLYIEKVAVRMHCEKRYVGKYLYDSVIQKYSNNLFYSFIVMKPYTNYSSLRFHEKMGFIECAKFKAKFFMGLKDYESIMFIKL